MKPLAEQTIVITGASSGIGLVTARMAAARGARVVLAARNEADLARAVERIRDDGGRAIAISADVSDPAQVEMIADAAEGEFGDIDTWVNNAGVSIYGRLMDLDLADMRRQLDVNFWGAVHGSLTAASRMLRTGGTIINVASALADRAIPLQGIYCAAKHAIKAFTDTLRMELEEENAPIRITLLKPSSMDTPFFQKAKTLLGREPQPIPPVYAPEVCARAILECAERPVRDLVVGGMGKVLGVAQSLSPRLTDLYMERSTFDAQSSDVPVAAGRPDNLYVPLPNDGGERGRYWSGRTKRTSLYTWAALHPGRAAALAAVAGAGIAALVSLPSLRSRRPLRRYVRKVSSAH
jgi:short-subunit dehydrogenase